MRARALIRPVGIFAAVIVASVSALAVGGHFLLSMLAPPCANDVLLEAASPDRKLKAVVFQRDCGATTDFSTQVVLLSPSSKPTDSAASFFISDSNHGIAPRGAGGGPNVQVFWVTYGHLVVSHHQSARIFRAEQKVGAVEVRYERLAN